MKREIKFRAWDTHKSEMSKPFDIGGYPLFPNDRTAPYWPRMCPIMQYAGLKDKNGKEIYEGDVLKRSREVEPSFLAVIEFKNGMFGGTTKPGNNYFIEMKRLPICDYGGTGYDEVIGNIYENPELLNSEPNDKRGVTTDQGDGLAK